MLSYIFWKMNPGSGRQRGIGGENKNEGNEVKGNSKVIFS